MNFFGRLARTLWGDITRTELRKFALLSVISFSFISTYSMLRPLKDILFMRFVGTLYLPYAKMASFAIMIPLTLIYGVLVDRLEKHRLFYIVCGFYGLLFLACGFLLAHPTLGLANESTNLYRLTGWLVYLGIESFIMISISLFWSFVAGSTSNESAKRGYPIIMALSQLGSIAGPELSKNAWFIGIPTLFIIGGLSLFALIAIIYQLVCWYPEVITLERSGKPTGPIEGLRLVLSRPYLMLITVTMACYTIVSALLEYQLNHCIAARFTTLEDMAMFTGSLIQATNLITFFFALVGSSFFIRTFGVRTCMVAFPVLVGGIIVGVWFNPSLWIIFGAIMALKSLSYALNHPCREILYVPTSIDVKFKAKSWIDWFGYRGSYALGGCVNQLFSSTAALMFAGPLVGIAICAAWATGSWQLGTMNQKLIADNEIIA